MATISQLTARLVDLFGSPSTANPAKLLNNLQVSPNGNVLVGSSTDNTSAKLQVNSGLSLNGYDTTGANMRVVAGNYGVMIRQDGSSCYFLSTASGTPYGTYNALRPFQWNLSTGAVTIAGDGANTNAGGNLTSGGTITCGTGAYNFVANSTNALSASGAFHVTQDLGMGWASWYGTGAVAVQHDSPNAAAAYVGMRWTHWGARHVAAIAAYEGGTTSSVCSIALILNSVSSPQFYFYDNGNAQFSGALAQNSDYRIKTNVATIKSQDALTGVLALRPVTYDRTDEHADGEEHIGFIAHEIQEVFPLLVTGEKDAVKTVKQLVGDKTPYRPGEEPEGYVPPVEQDVVVPDLQSVNYIGMVPYLVSAIQELKRELDLVKSELEELKVNK
jgi:hypothetical protein